MSVNSPLSPFNNHFKSKDALAAEAIASAFDVVASDLSEKLASGKHPQAAVYGLCMDLAKDHVVSDASFKKARELFSDQQIVDLIMVSGVYITLAMLSNTAEDATPLGKTLPLQPLPAH
jgi:4-carboxymuconolactone decarboxylase